jgi:hypothetical protein
MVGVFKRSFISWRQLAASHASAGKTPSKTGLKVNFQGLSNGDLGQRKLFVNDHPI